MKPGDLVRMNPSKAPGREKSFPLYFTPTQGRDTTDTIHLHENYVVLEVMFFGDITEVRLLTPRGTVGWSIGRYFEVICEAG